MSRSKNSDAQHVQEYVDGVGAVLQKDDVNAEDIESICDGLREQIYDIAGQNSEVDDESIIRAIASMEAPGDFATSLHNLTAGVHRPLSEETDDEVKRLLGSIGLYVAICGPVLALVLGMIVGATQGEGWEFGSFIVFATAIIALIFGVAARRTARGGAAIFVALGTVVGYFVLVLIALLVN